MQTTLEAQLPRSTPEAQGISSTAITNFLTGVEKEGLEFHSFMLLRHGHVVAEGWWNPYSADRVHLLYSVSKSFTSTAIGFAVDEGLLSEDDFVTSFFPEYVPEVVSENLAAMRVRHLLSMATGHTTDTTERVGQNDTWVKNFLSLPPEQAPGSIFCYNSGATFMLSAILQKVTDMKLVDYLQPRLFEPLGITQKHWDETPQGMSLGFSGFYTTSESIAKLGQLYLQKGVWQGKRLLSKYWVDTATREHIPNASPTQVKTADWEQGYGYQFWRCQHGAYRADGAFGQFCVVMPEQDAVLAVTSAVGNMQTVLDLAYKHLLPAMNDKGLEPSPNHSLLLNQLTNLNLAPVRGHKDSSVVTTVSGKVYQLENSQENLPSVMLHFRDETCLLSLSDGQQEHRVTCGYNKWLSGTTTLPAEVNLFHNHADEIEASGAWTDTNTFVMKIIYVETPHCLTATFHFDRSKLTVKRKWNVSFGSLELPELNGEIKP
jgi:CubicO group peptidase (beta-lactamase class C family)